MAPEHALRDAPSEAEAARTRLAHAAQALEHVSDGVIVVDLCWRITFANSTAAALVEHKVEELVGPDAVVDLAQLHAGNATVRA